MGELVYRSEYPPDASRHLHHLAGGDDAEDQVCLVLSSPYPGGRVEICYDDDLAVGVLQFTQEAGPDRFYVRHFSVIPSHQKRGIGRSLVERVQEKAREATLPISVSDISDEAIPVFLKCGFREGDGSEPGLTLWWSGVPD